MKEISRTILELKNASKVYQMGEIQVHALQNVDLEIKEGNYVSIMGPSGSGKTTLLDVISALLRPSHGDVFIEGKSIRDMSDNELAKIRGKTIGFVFQTFNLISSMTALENVMLPLWFQGVPIKQREKLATQKLIKVGLGNRLHHRPMELSGGQRQRVAIARALSVDPKIIVADEPTGNLDSQSGEQILKLFQDLNTKENKTIVMVTHEMDIAKKGDHIVNIKDGKILNVKKNR